VYQGFAWVNHKVNKAGDLSGNDLNFHQALLNWLTRYLVTFVLLRNMNGYELTWQLFGAQVFSLYFKINDY